jgi:hypothetical protein
MSMSFLFELFVIKKRQHAFYGWNTYLASEMDNKD